MELAIIVVAILGFGLFFFVLKRLLRMALRLALFGAILVALLVGAAAWWWSSSQAPLDGSANRSGNTNTARPARAPR